MGPRDRRVDHRFHGRIIGVGSTVGVRLVVGHWERSPLGAFTDVMVAEPDGRRVLLAPDDRVAEFVCATYIFDDVRVDHVVGSWRPDDRGGRCRVDSALLRLTVRVGRRTSTGWVLHALPRPLATAPAFSRAVDPIARWLQPGVRTWGTARAGRQEFYGATDVRAVVGIDGEYAGRPLGRLAPVWPPPRFGFSSTPRKPAMTTVVTTVRVLPGR